MEAYAADPVKRRLVAGLLGQCFVVAWNTIRENKDECQHVADRLVAEKELYGDEVNDMLNNLRMRKPTIDVLDETTWPVI